MPEYKYQNVLLHQLPDGQGWEIIGIKANRTRELIAIIPAGVDENLVRVWADKAAQLLAGKIAAQID